ncbi:MAG TPA: hypothetical protein PK728_00650 [Bacillota bacterium]|nr:hypothetical protein [Bacillota bacterium]
MPLFFQEPLIAPEISKCIEKANKDKPANVACRFEQETDRRHIHIIFAYAMAGNLPVDI